MVSRLVLIAGCLLGLALWIGALVSVIVPNEQTQIRSAQAALGLQRLVTVVNSQVEQLERLATAAANRPGLATALERGLPQARRIALEADFTTLLPGGVSTRLFRRGEAQLEPNASPPVSFATLDLISSVENGLLPPPESFILDDLRLIRLARPIVTPAGDPVGTLLLVVDQNQALSPLGTAVDLGRLSIIQTFDGARAQTIMGIGAGSGEPITAKTRHPYWSLSLQPNPALAEGLGINLTHAIAAGSIALLCSLAFGLIAIGLVYRTWREELTRLTQYILASHRDPNSDVPQFKDPAMAKAAQTLASKHSNAPRPFETPSPTDVAEIPEPPTSAPPAPSIPKASLPEASSPQTPIAQGPIDLPSSPETANSLDMPITDTAVPATSTPDTPADEAQTLPPLEFPSSSNSQRNQAELPTQERLNSASAPDEPTAPKDSGSLDLTNLNLELEPLETTEFSLPNDYRPDPDMFRAYDVRGIVTAGLDEHLAYALGKALASEARAQGQTRIVTGGDGRLSTPELKSALNQGIVSAGVDVLDIGIVPTPLVYYGANVTNTQTGVMVTGSHNPKDYNGFKMVVAGNTLAGEEIQDLLRRINQQDWDHGQGEISQSDLVDGYISEVSKSLKLETPIKVVIDCGNGVAGMMAERFFESLGVQVTALFADVDGNFPNHHPDPSKPKNLIDLQNKVAELNADIGFAFDGDADRVGVITAQGTNVFADKLLMVLAQDVATRNPGAKILYDVKCSRHLNQIISDAGGVPEMCATGHSLVKKKMRETGALLAGEMSGHVFYKDGWYGFDDALYTAARIMDLLARSTGSLDDLLDALPKDVGTPEINLTVNDQSKFTIVQNLSEQGWFEGGELSTIDGVRVDYSDGFGLVRASNTTPVLVLRFEAATEAALARITQQFKTQLALVEPELELDF